MKVNRRRLARVINLTVFILALGLAVGFGSSYLGQIFSGSFNLRASNPGYSAIASTKTNQDNSSTDEKQVTELLDQLGELIKQCDSILTQDRIGFFDDQKIEELRSQLYLVHIELNHLLLQNP